MKFENKLKIASLVLLLQVNAFANTNWDKLVEVANNVEIENVKADSAGLIQFKVAKLPNERIRFMGFTSYNSQSRMILTVHSKKNELEKICNDYSVFKKSFKADLSFNVTPAEDTFEFTMKNGRQFTTLDFENNFTNSEAEAALSDSDKFPWILNSGDMGKFKDVGVKQGVVNLLNNAITNREGDMVTVDLSNYNGLACDIASGYMRPSLSKTISFEKALPESSFWINQDSFTEIYKTFWSTHAQITSDLKSEEAKASELVLLGLSLANKPTEKESVFKGKGRVLSLFNALKFNSSLVISKDTQLAVPVDQWKKTFEYSIPTNTQVKQKMTFTGGDISVSLME